MDWPERRERRDCDLNEENAKRQAQAIRDLGRKRWRARRCY